MSAHASNCAGWCGECRRRAAFRDARKLCAVCGQMPARTASDTCRLCFEAWLYSFSPKQYPPTDRDIADAESAHERDRGPEVPTYPKE